jgi:hypothetical protein
VAVWLAKVNPLVVTGGRKASTMVPVAVAGVALPVLEVGVSHAQLGGWGWLQEKERGMESEAGAN